MPYAKEHIVDAYSELLGSLSKADIREIISRLSASLKKDRPVAEEAFYASFGGFASDLSAEEIITGIRASRSFRRRDIDF